MINKISQGEIWLVDFEPQVGSEIAKLRPAVVINNDLGKNYDIKIILPITTYQDKFKDIPFFYKLKEYKKLGLENASAINCFQIKSFSSQRFKQRLGKIDEKTLFEIHQIFVEILNPFYILKIE
ncbi:type II toxin-antitoxin system PemK/MazF family toxin [Campylobacter devanensis]|uniref:type II toxin-antitoxin system PemK/MazF family toxin n=1 Tax=Campylobacter devanensis TaxID=3161138 RepID=UPI001EF0E2E9|nr:MULTISPECIES: type II toxin-antitoxin system PemK/MazF family toxin [unclassified Campylobacter]